MGLQNTLRALADPTRRGGPYAPGDFESSEEGAAFGRGDCGVFSGYAGVCFQASFGAEGCGSDPGYPGGEVYFL